MARQALQEGDRARVLWVPRGLLAGQRPKLNDRPLAEQSSVLNLRAGCSQRIEELLALDQITEARREWFTLTRGFSD